MSLLNKRNTELIKAMADRFENGMYVDGSFLREHDVASGELGVFDVVASLLKGIVRLPASKQLEIIALGSGCSPSTARTMHDTQRMKELTEEMQKIQLK